MLEACTGIAQHVKDFQAESGVKDGFTQHWIERLIDESRTMRKSRPGLTPNEIKAEMGSWITRQEDKIYNPFLRLKG